MLLIAGSPSLRRAAIDQLADAALAGLRRRPRDLRPDAPAAEQPAPGDPRGGRRRATSSGSGTTPFLDAGGGDRRRAAAPARRRWPGRWPRPTPRSPPTRRRPARLTPALRDERAATPRRVAAGRPRPAPGRDRREGGLERLDARRAASRRPGLRARRPRPGRRSPRAASSGRRSWPSSSPSSTSLTALDGRPPLLLLDDVFCELDPERRSHLVRRIAALPQAFVTTTTLDDLDPELRAIATAWEVAAGAGGAEPRRAPRRRPRRERRGHERASGAGRWSGSAT